MKKSTISGKNVLVLYTIILFFSTCNYPTYESYDIIEESTDEADAETEDIIIIQEVQTMELQPIKEYQKYIVSGQRVYGITGDKAEPITLKDVDDNRKSTERFFILDGVIYLSVMVVEIVVIPDSDPEESEQVLKEYFFSQTGGMIQEELEKDFPSEPASEHVTYSDSLFKIETTPYPIDGEMTDTSRVFKGPSPTGYLKIDGCARVSHGLWYSVPMKLPYRPAGVYFYPENANLIRIFDGGRIW